MGQASAAIRPSGPLRVTLRRLRGNLALQDVCCLAYHGYMLLRVALAPGRTMAAEALPTLGALLAITALTVFLVRGELMPAGRGRALFYRAGVILPIILSYVPLRPTLLSLGRPLEDALLWHLDERLFGRTAAQLLEPLVSPATVEWFSFFYYSYFTLVGVHVFGTALFDRGRRAAELLFAAMAICCIGQTLYTLMPGVGPFAAVPFQRPLIGGFFFGLVQRAVRQAGALLDIFPSLHTAYPTLLTLHSLRHRRALPYRYSLPVTALFNANILIATLFLRWHYAVDVVAGLLLALFAQRLGILAAVRESDERRFPAQPVWEPLLR